MRTKFFVVLVYKNALLTIASLRDERLLIFTKLGNSSKIMVRFICLMAHQHLVGYLIPKFNSFPNVFFLINITIYILTIRCKINFLNKKRR